MTFKKLYHATAFAAFLAAMSIAAVHGAYGRAEAASGANKSVIASFYPLYVHLLNIAGDRASVEVLLPPGAGVHDFSCKPSDIKKVAGSALVVVNGAGLDAFAVKIAENYAGAGLKIADASYGVELITISDAAASRCAGHAHVGDESVAHGVSNKNGAGPRLCDPHTWLSPKNAITQIKNIAGAMSGVDPSNSSFYEANAAAYIKKIEELDGFAVEKLAPFKGSKFIVFHGSFAYFARDYGLAQDSIADAFGNAPKPSRIKEIYDAIKKENIKFLVAEPGYQNKEIKALSEQYALDIIELDPMGSYDANRTAGAERDYFIDTMKSNIVKLSAAFEKASRK